MSMSQAEALLNSLSSENISAYTIDPLTEPHIIIGSDRYITVPDVLKRIAVQHDHNIETVTFDCPRYWDEHDMSEMYVYIHYERADGEHGLYLAKNVLVDETDDQIMHFDWTISRNVSAVVGNLTVQVCIKRMDAEGYEVNHWNSELNKDMYVSEGLDCGDDIGDQQADVITQIIDRLEQLEANTDDGDCVKTVNNIAPDENGNVEIQVDASDVDLSEYVTIDELEETTARYDELIAVLESNIADLSYEPIVINTFTNNVGTVEKGTTVSEVTFNWVYSKTPTAATLDGDEIDVSLTSKTLTDLSITSTKTFILSATDERGATASKTSSISVLSGVYYGVGAVDATIDSDFVLSLSKKLQGIKAVTFTVTPGVDENIYYCIPSSYGTPTFTVGGFDGGFDLVSTFSFTNATGFAEEYDVYKSANSNLGATTVVVK